MSCYYCTRDINSFLISQFIVLTTQGSYTSGHLKFKAIQDFPRLFEKEIQDCFNDICPVKRSKLS